ncbi:hypothetical protein MMC14_010053 [Varicellaria rhodocarpa]|nr:hypothetical protein [Varicellaria rhodocarpa]
MGPLSETLDDHCCYCGRAMDVYATFEELPGQVVSRQGITRNEQWKALPSVTVKPAEGEKGEEHMEDGSSLPSSSANTGSMQLNSTSDDSHQDKDDETREQADENRDSGLKRAETTSRLLERLGDSLTSTFTKPEQNDEQKVASDLVPLEDDTFSEVLGCAFDYHNFEKDISINIPSKIEEYLANLEKLPNQDITVSAVPGTSVFALNSHRRRQSYTIERRRETAKTRKERRACDECKKQKIRCQRPSLGADCEQCTKMNRPCRRSNRIAISRGSQSSSQQVDDRGVMQEEPETSAFDAEINAEINATVYEQDAVVADLESQTVNSDDAILRDTAQEDPGISAFDTIIHSTMYDQDLVVPDMEFESMMSHQVDIRNTQGSRLLPTSMLSDSLDAPDLINFLDFETNSMFPTYSYHPRSYVPSILQNRETIIMATPNLDPSQNFDFSNFPFGN